MVPGIHPPYFGPCRRRRDRHHPSSPASFSKSLPTHGGGERCQAVTGGPPDNLALHRMGVDESGFGEYRRGKFTMYVICKLRRKITGRDG